MYQRVESQIIWARPTGWRLAVSNLDNAKNCRHLLFLSSFIEHQNDDFKAIRQIVAVTHYFCDSHFWILCLECVHSSWVNECEYNYGWHCSVLQSDSVPPAHPCLESCYWHCGRRASKRDPCIKCQVSIRSTFFCVLVSLLLDMRCPYLLSNKIWHSGGASNNIICYFASHSV